MVERQTSVLPADPLLLPGAPLLLQPPGAPLLLLPPAAACYSLEHVAVCGHRHLTGTPALALGFSSQAAGGWTCTASNVCARPCSPPLHPPGRHGVP